MLRLLSALVSGPDQEFLQARIRSVACPSAFVRRMAYGETQRPEPKWHYAFIGLGQPVFIKV